MKKVLLLIFVLFSTFKMGNSWAQNDDESFKINVSLIDDIPSNPYKVTLNAIKDSSKYYSYTKKNDVQEFSFTIKSKLDTISTKSFSLDLKQGNILLEGPYYFKKNGVLTEQGSFSQNRPIGIWQYFSPNATLYKQIIYNIDGNGTELHKFFNANGNLQRSVEIRSNQYVGREELYSEHEKLQAILHYQNSVLQGEIETFDSLGNLSEKYIAEKGIITKSSSALKNTPIDVFELKTDSMKLLHDLLLPFDYSHLRINKDAKLEVLIDEANTIQKVWIQDLEVVNKSLEEALHQNLEGKILPLKKSFLGFPIPIMIEANLSLYLQSKYYLSKHIFDEMMQIYLPSDFNWSYIEEKGWVRILELQLEDQTLIIPDEMPQFPGGDKALMKFLRENVKYPHLAQKHGIMGRVYTSFVVAKDGTLIDIKIAKNADPTLDKEAIRVVNAMPKWIPGKKDGHPINVKYMLPVNFVLN